jgi:ribosome-binding protein aMBF1 (putative translation factor)
MAEVMACAACGAALTGRKTLMDYKGESLWLCERCSSLAMERRYELLKPRLKAIDQQVREREAAKVRYRSDIPESQLEPLLVHAFLDLIEERKAAGRRELAATMETIATWLSDRTRLPVKPLHVQYLTLALRDGHIITVGGGGIGRPNTYDTTEAAMGLDGFWDQVDAFLLVWRMPNRMSLLQLEA